MFFFSHLHICKSGFFSYYYFPLQTSLLLLRHCLFFSSSFIPYLDFFPFSFFHSPSCSLFFLFRLLLSSLMHNFIPLFSSPFCLSSFLSLPSYSYSSCYPRFPIFFHSVITSYLFFPSYSQYFIPYPLLCSFFLFVTLTFSSAPLSFKIFCLSFSLSHSSHILCFHLSSFNSFFFLVILTFSLFPNDNLFTWFFFSSPSLLILFFFHILFWLLFFFSLS